MTLRIGIIGAGISGLATGWRLKQSLEEKNIPFSMSIYDRNTRTGGSIRTDEIDGFRVEWGPNGFLNTEPATFELLRELNLRDRISVSSDDTRKRYLLIRNQLQPIPTSPGMAIRSGILPLSAKLRFAMEPFIKRPAPNEDESVADFVTRRFGKYAATRLFDPLMSGIYGGNAAALSIHATLKVFAQFEREHGSVVKGMIARVKQRRAEAQAPPSPSDDPLLTTSRNPMSNKLLSFPNGLSELVNALTERLQPHLQLESAIQFIRRNGKGFLVTYENERGNQEAHHDLLIVATPPMQASKTLDGLDGSLAGFLRQIPSSSIAVVALGFNADDIGHPLDGFGYLIPRGEGIRTLGVLWTSSIFPGRAPEGKKLLRVMIGGAHDPQAVQEKDEDLIRIALDDLRQVLQCKGAPIMTQVIRHTDGIPQYTLGHNARLQQIEERLGMFPGLYLAGNGYHGISTNDCIRKSNELIERITAQLPLS